MFKSFISENQMKEIRLGTIGSGFIVNSILDAAEKTEGIRLEAVYSRSQEKAEFLRNNMEPGKYILI